MKRLSIILFSFFSLLIFTSCEDFFKQESDDVLYADKDHLNNAVDTIYSITGILNKLQALADRTILLGEVRGDLVTLTDEASNDLRDLANFNVGDDNKYNKPSDYYAVINNCNYFIAKADTALKSNRNEYIFMREWAAAKSIRAWVYLQLALNYGQVPFITEPILSKEEAESQFPKYDLAAVCRWFIDDLSTIPERYNTEFPMYGSIRNTESALFYFPLSIIRGELYLWLASQTKSPADYRQAALNYYQYIKERNGENSTYETGDDRVNWIAGSSEWMRPDNNGFASAFYTERYTKDAELITMIPGDSIPAEGNYSELRNLFNSNTNNDYKVSITPSMYLFNLSESQANCVLSSTGLTAYYSPAGLSEHRSGDLRLSAVYDEDYTYNSLTLERIMMQDISKYSTRNVHIYRKQMVYLRMAEALNQAGFPRMAFKILSEGLSNKLIQDSIMPYYAPSDSVFLAKFDFPDSRYGVMTYEDVTGRPTATHNMMGIHSRGSGWTPKNAYYVLPNDTLETDDTKRAQLTAELKVIVDSLIINEAALEFAFEGTRFYDLMRYAWRQPNPGAFMTKQINGRKGEGASEGLQLSDPRSWYLKWKGEVGY